MRRRHQLRPDTFPFLAVLLCAMGSLILVLMELDRRARSQAHARAEQVWHKTEQDKTELLAHLRAEREAARQRQLQSRETRLLAHRSEVRQLHEAELAKVAERTHVQSQLDELLLALQADREQHSSIEKRREQEQQMAAQIERDLTARREQLDRSRQKVEGSRAERERLTRDLLLLEEALHRLQEQRKREGKTWSVVPYVGKRGLNRRPLYVECDANGIVFHPERKRLSNETASLDTIREEVKRRGKEFVAKLPAGEKNREPYWMLLVRPDGILAYYQFVHAVKPLETAYGYEFVDETWNLDFPDPATLPQPVEVATPLPTPVRRPDPRYTPPGVGRGGSPQDIVTGRPGFPFGGTPAAELLSPQMGRSTFPGTGIGGGGPFAKPTGRGTGTGESRTSGQEGGSALTPGGGGGAPSPTPGGNGDAPLTALPTRFPKASLSPPLGGNGDPTNGRGGSGEPRGQTRGGEGSATGEAGAAGEHATGGEPTSGVVGGREPQPRVDGEQGNASGEGHGSLSSKGASSAKGGRTGPPQPPGPLPPGQSVEDGAEPRERGVATTGLDGPTSSEPLKPAARYGSRELVLVIDCMPEGVRLSPSRLVILVDNLGRDRGGEALLRAVQKQVTRRRAVLRAGDPPLKVTIRFVVHKNGLRAFHMAYPLLDSVVAEKRTVLSGE